MISVFGIGAVKMSAVKDETFITLLKTSGVGQSLLNEVAQKKLDQRLKLTTELASLNAEVESAYPKYERMRADALAVVRVAERALADSHAKFRAVEHERSSKGLHYESRRSQIEQTLRLGASPEIEKFKSEMIDEQQLLQRPGTIVTETRPVKKASGAVRHELVWSNRDSVLARMRGLLEACRLAEALKLEPDQSNIAERLAAIRAGLPAIDAGPLSGS